MSKVTSKLQLTVPKAIADEYGIRPGDELQWVPAGDSIRVIPVRKGRRVQGGLTLEQRLATFRESMRRQELRNQKFYAENGPPDPATDRGWKREDLYTRGFTR